VGKKAGNKIRRAIPNKSNENMIISSKTKKNKN
jgi:hypothetical protein